MASEHTQNYNLSRWTLADELRMEDFNSDNEKIDAALAEKYGVDNPLFVTGTYVGTGTVGVEQRIELGFCPSAVIIIGYAAFGFFIRSGTESYGVSSFNRYDNNLLGFSGGGVDGYETGFTVVRTYSSYSVTMNEQGKSYFYIAFR